MGKITIWRSGMFWQFFAASGGILILCLVGLGAIIINWTENNEYRQAEEELQGAARLVQESLGGNSLEHIHMVQERLHELEEELHVRIDLLLDESADKEVSSPGTIQVLELEKDTPEVVQASELGKGVHFRPSSGSKDSMMFLALRIDSPGPLRFIRVGLSTRIIEQRIQAFRWQVWSTIVVTMIVGFLLSFLLTLRIIRPLHELAVSAGQIAAGDYGRKIFAEGASEVGILARHFNITSERLAAQFAQMDEDRQQLRAVLSSMAEGVIAVDADQRILFANERAAQLLEFETRTAVGRRLWEVVRYRPIQEVVESALNDCRVDQNQLSCNGTSDKYINIYAGPLPGRPPRGVVLVLHDITELRRLERIRRDFVANVSHELKTPLTVIQANVETLLDGAVEDAEHRGLFLKRIADQSERLKNLIQDLISLARIESGSESYTFEAVAVEDVVQACMQRRRTLVETKHQTLEIFPPSRTLYMWADEEAVLQILDNLVDNAIKYTPENGRISVRWWQEDDRISIEVRDTGIGIPERNLARIFERFYRVDKARSREMGGTGLGLSIVKHLTQAMKGGINDESKLHEGSTFTVWLPCHSE